MTTEHEQFIQQERWNDMGKRRLAEMRGEPDRFLVTRSPHAHRPCHADLMNALGPLSGKRVLESGCGRGEFAVFLAKQGADVTGVDIGPELTAASNALAAINNVSCRFHTGSISQLPFTDGEFDIVIGIDVLHHLVEDDVKAAMAECHRVLAENGCAFVVEPVENSKAFDFMQHLIPVGTRGGGDYRPSILQRAAWREFLKHKDQRALTNRELISVGTSFRSVRVRPYGFLFRLRRLLGQRSRRPLAVIDEALLRMFPPLTHLCDSVLVEYRK